MCVRAVLDRMQNDDKYVEKLSKNLRYTLLYGYDHSQ